MNPGAKINREPFGQTMLIQCSTPNAKVQVPKMIQWQDVKLPTEWLLEQETPLAKPVFDELDLTHIQQYLDGTIKISFHNNQPLRINEGRHFFAGSESISKRDQDLDDFLQKSFEKPIDLKLKGVSSDKSQVSTVFYSTKPEVSSPYGRTANEEEEDTRSLNIVEIMLSDLKVKTEGTFTSTPATRIISKNEIVSEENTDSGTVSSVSAKMIFDDDLPEIKRFVGNSKPMSFTKNWYSKPTPHDMQFEERSFQTQFFVSANKLYEWNIDDLSEQEIINKMGHMSMVGIAYQNNHDLDQPKIVDLLVTGFFGTLCG